MPWTPSQIPSQREKHAIVTGANSGIGYFTALELARAGAHVVLACRGSKGDDAAKRICQEIPEARVSGAQLDLADLSSVRTFAAAQDGNPLDLLINNAGVMAIPTRTFTKDGFETQFGTNHLGHFALTALLLPSLLASPSPRVTVVSSGAHKMGKIDFDNLQGERSYSAWGAYCQSKLANLLFMLELQRQAKLAGSSLLCTGAHPGYALTNLQTSGPGKFMSSMMLLIAPLLAQDAAHGAWPTELAATDPDAQPGNYYGPTGFQELKGNPALANISARANDEPTARRLWEVSLKLTSVVFPWH
jgi:NAD(P)-dependent dehydrogenase (short-subunit alcohol dehydrogenase family)